jgi:hypothetical protein
VGDCVQQLARLPPRAFTNVTAIAHIVTLVLAYHTPDRESDAVTHHKSYYVAHIVTLVMAYHKPDRESDTTACGSTALDTITAMRICATGSLRHAALSCRSPLARNPTPHTLH